MDRLKNTAMFLDDDLTVYPFNLILTIRNKQEMGFPVGITEDIRAGLRYVLSTLSDVEQEYLHLRYRERKPLVEIGKILNLSREQMAQVEKAAISKLRHPSKWNYIRYGVAGLLKKSIKDEYNKGYHMGYGVGYKKGTEDEKNGKTPQNDQVNIMGLPITELKLSTYTVNGLRRAGIEDLGGIVKQGEGGILVMRKIGPKSADEVARKLIELGIRYTAWEKYLL